MKNLLLFMKIFLFFINNIYATLIYLISFSTFCFLTNITQLEDVFVFVFMSFYYILKPCYIVVLADINPRLKRSSLICCQWNLNGVACHEFIKVSLLQGYITERIFNITCLSETFFNSFSDSEHDRLKIKRYNLIRPEHYSD